MARFGRRLGFLCASSSDVLRRRLLGHRGRPVTARRARGDPLPFGGHRLPAAGRLGFGLGSWSGPIPRGRRLRQPGDTRIGVQVGVPVGVGLRLRRGLGLGLRGWLRGRLLGAVPPTARRLLGVRLGFRGPAVRATESRRRPEIRFGRLRFGGHVDDRTFFGARLALVDVDVGVGAAQHLVESAAAHPAGGLRVWCPVAVVAHGGAVVFERGPVRQVGVEEDLQIGPQRGELGTQRGHLVSGLGLQFVGQLAAQLRLHRQLVLAAGGDLAVQLEIVDEFEIARLGLVVIALPSIDDRDERRGHRRPQSQDDSEF